MHEMWSLPRRSSQSAVASVSDLISSPFLPLPSCTSCLLSLEGPKPVLPCGLCPVGPCCQEALHPEPSDCSLMFWASPQLSLPDEPSCDHPGTANFLCALSCLLLS